MLGELLPFEQGHPIELEKEDLLVGRRDNCDIRLPFANVSGRHCRLHHEGKHWVVFDLNSRNGIRINNVRVQEGRLLPGDVLSIARHRFTIMYALDEGRTLKL